MFGKAVDDGETAAIIMSLRQKLKAQTEEVVSLQSKLSSLTSEHKSEVRRRSLLLPVNKLPKLI
jgi:hypothetical protein